MTNIFDSIKNLKEEHIVIEKTANRIADLSEDLDILFEVKGSTFDFTPVQYNLISERRINLRHNIIGFKEGLQNHYSREEKILHPLLADAVKQNLNEQHQELLKKLAETDELLLSLGPVGMIFNGPYLQQKLSTLRASVYELNAWEDKLLELAGLFSGAVN
jgi:hypothetical protein